MVISFNSKCDSVSVGHRVYRVKVVRSFMKARVPLNKIDCFRVLLEEGAFSFFYLSDFIDVIAKDGRKKLKEEIKQK